MYHLFISTPSVALINRVSLRIPYLKTLSRYFPFSGRIRDRAFVDCNDEGVVFLEARVKCMLSEILENPSVTPQTQEGPKREGRTIKSENVEDFLFFSSSI